MCHDGTRECTLLLGFGFQCVGTTHILPLGVSFALVRTNKIKTIIWPYLRLSAETKIAVPDGTSLGFKPPAWKCFWLDLRYYIYLQGFELTVQAALWIYNLSALSLIALTVNEKISLLASSDQMAPPSGLPPPLKSWTKLFTFVFDSVDLFVLLLFSLSVTSVYLPLCFLYHHTIEKYLLLWYNE